jgi:oxygen-independent coproporphyrinogen-3 oxidase
LTKKAGFENISIDLIYGIPGFSLEIFERNLKKAFEMNIQHISAYHLTIEKKTAFYLKKKKGELEEIPEEESILQFEKLVKLTEENQFIQYEISNFSKTGFISKHNSNYWKQIKYLGIGPSAHSYNTFSRQWNVSNNKQYIESINKGQVPFTMEKLDLTTRYNEYIISSLRTMWGADLIRIEEDYSVKLKNYCLKMASGFIRSGQIIRHKNQLVLSTKGKFISDAIISKLLYVGLAEKHIIN